MKGDLVMDHNLNQGGADKETTLGFDNADILAEKRRRDAAAAAKSTPAVSANTLRAQMQAGNTKAPSGGPQRPASGAVPARPQTAAAQPAARPAHAASGTVRPVSSVPRPTAPKAPSQSKITGAANTRPSAPSVSPKKVTPTSTGTISQHPAKPESQRQTAMRPSPAAKPAMIPYKQVSTKPKASADDGATRVTDIRDIRPLAQEDNNSTRLTSISKSMPTPKAVPRPEERDESEGGNTIISIIKAITYIVAVIVVSVFLSMFIILVGNDVFAFVKDDTLVEVTIPEYATVHDIAEILHENEVIEYPSIFRLYAYLKKVEVVPEDAEDPTVFVAGTYTVHPMMNYDELISAFKKKKPSGISRITIPEGYTTDEIIDLFVSHNIGTREGYIDVINHYDFDYWFIDELETNGVSEDRFYRLDGYLFPDTYEFYNASSEEVVIGKLLKRFNQVFLDSYAQKARELGYSVDEILIIASLIEKEAGTQSDFFDISSVFNNRLNAPSKYPYLESDATVVYAIHHETGERINPTGEDMTYESPYNTYTNKGLPPGPIANPSASAIRAALYPSDTDYYYFFSESTYVTHYSTTYEEHKKVIAEVMNKNNPSN